MANKRRILKSEKFLSQFFRSGDELHIGILWEDYIKSTALADYGLPNVFVENKEVSPLAKGGATKANSDGKYGRKQPEQKTTRTVHISYIRKDGAHIDYNRDFNVYVKELLHKYNMKFVFRTNEHGQQVVVSPVLRFTDENSTNLMNTHAINLFLEVFGEFEAFNSELNPAIKFNKKYEYDFLPKGKLIKEDNDKIKDILDSVEKYLENPAESKAFAKRLFTIVEFKPDLRGRGPEGFYGYIVFGFKNRGITILESMYKGDATYIFDDENFEEIIKKSKKEILDNKLHKERFVHLDNWEDKIRTYLNSFGVDDNPEEDPNISPAVTS